jgi:PAS domain S-box-containing protein
MDYQNELVKLSRAVEQSPASVLITDLDGKIEYVNPKFMEVTGYSMDEVKGKNPRILKSDYYTKEDYKELWDTITSGNIWKGELRNRRKNGEIYWEHASISPIKNEYGVITHYVGVKEDITKRKEYQELLESQNILLHEIAWMQSHTVRAPIAKILGLISLMEDKDFSEIPESKLISEIKESAEVIDDILRKISGKIELVNEKFIEKDA